MRPSCGRQWCSRMAGGSMKNAGLAFGCKRDAIAVAVLGTVASMVPPKRSCRKRCSKIYYIWVI